MPITGRPSLRDDGGACVVRAMRGMNALSAYHGHAERLSALARTIARGQAHLGGLGRAAPTSTPPGYRSASATTKSVLRPPFRR